MMSRKIGDERIEMVFKYLFILRVCEQVWGAETEGERESQADSPDPLAEHRAWLRPAPWPWDRDPSGSQELDTQQTELRGQPIRWFLK